MFTVAISVGLTPELLQAHHLEGILSEPWIKNQTFPSSADWFNLSVVLLGSMVLTLSWFGYRLSVATQPLKPNELGMFRFVLDILMVVIYGFMLISFKSFLRVMVLLSAVLWIYAVWDVMKILEDPTRYAEASQQSRLREFVWIPFALLCTLLAMGLLNGWVDQLITLPLAFASIIVPRILKIRLPRVGG